MKKSDTPLLDRVILHNKNADERLFDMILRIITFIVLIIIIWIYADLAHAKADGLTMAQYYNIDFTKLPVSTDGSLMWQSDEYAALLAEYTDIPFDSNYHPNYITTGAITNQDLGRINVPDNCYGFYCSSGNENWYAYFIPKELIDNHTVLYTRNGFYSTSDFSFYACSIWYNTTVYQPVSVQFNSSQGVQHLTNDQYCSTAYCYFSNCPCWTGTNLDPTALGGPVNYNGIIQRLSADDFEEDYSLFNCNYFLYGNILRNPWDSIEDVESNLNHLYFEDVQIGLTGQSANQDIISSEIIVGVSVDDWVLNHINDYYVHIAYNFHMKDSYTQQADPDFTITKIVPLRAFMNDGYVYSVYDLFQDGNFLSYYRMINSTYKIYVKNSYETLYDNSIIPTLMRWVSYGFSDYYMMQVESIQEQYNIFDFGLDVTVQLSSGALGGAGNMSYPYTKAFDFLNGSSSVTSAEGLRNHNPWLGETTPQANPLVPVSGSDVVGTSGGYGGGNNTVNVNVSGQKVPMNVQTQQEINNTLTNYTNAFETFSNSIRSLADTESQNNFYAVLSNTVPMIPGVNIFLQYVALTCGVMLILLVLKILLF